MGTFLVQFCNKYCMALLTDIPIGRFLSYSLRFYSQSSGKLSVELYIQCSFGLFSVKRFYIINYFLFKNSCRIFNNSSYILFFPCNVYFHLQWLSFARQRLWSKLERVEDRSHSSQRPSYQSALLGQKRLKFQLMFQVIIITK